MECPFCGAAETDRFDLEGKRYLVFRCMFTPAVDPTATDTEIAAQLRREYADGAKDGYFRQMCDRLHLHVTQGPGATALLAERDRARSEREAERPTS
jgi:hypothetical protein